MPELNEKKPTADAGPVERMVRPVAQVQRMGSSNGVPHFGCLLNIEAERRLKVNDPLYDQAAIDHEFRRGFIDGQVSMREGFTEVLLAVELILNAGHMNTEDLARLRTAFERA